MGLCQQCVHFSTKDSEEYVTYCARCRNRNKFVRRTDDNNGANTGVNANANAQSAIDSLRQRQAQYQPYVAPKPQSGQIAQGQQIVQTSVNSNAQVYAGAGIAGSGGVSGIGLQNMQGNLQNNIPNMQMPWQNIIQSDMTGLNQNNGGQVINGQSAGGQKVNGRTIPPFSFVNNSNTGAGNMQGTGQESREDLTLRRDSG